jgi:hypothetical protein
VPRIGDVERYEAVGAAFAGRLGCVSSRIGDVGNLWAGSFSKERIVGGIGNNGTGDDPVQQKIKYDRVPRKNQVSSPYAVRYILRAHCRWFFLSDTPGPPYSISLNFDEL